MQVPGSSRRRFDVALRAGDDPNVANGALMADAFALLEDDGEGSGGGGPHVSAASKRKIRSLMGAHGPFGAANDGGAPPAPMMAMARAPPPPPAPAGTPLTCTVRPNCLAGGATVPCV